MEAIAETPIQKEKDNKEYKAYGELPFRRENFIVILNESRSSYNFSKKAIKSRAY